MVDIDEAVERIEQGDGWRFLVFREIPQAQAPWLQRADGRDVNTRYSG
jgi:hypothetical protein